MQVPRRRRPRRRRRRGKRRGRRVSVVLLGVHRGHVAAAAAVRGRARGDEPAPERRACSAAALGVPRLSFMGASAFTQVVRELAMRDKPGATPTPHQDGHPGSDDDASTDTYTVPVFPHLRFKLSEFAPMSASDIELHAKASAAVAASQGVIVNTFQDLESRYIDHWNRCIGPRAWPIGPLCLARYSHSVDDRVHAKPSWIRWWDEEAEVGFSLEGFLELHGTDSNYIHLYNDYFSKMEDFTCSVHINKGTNLVKGKSWSD
ncbi:hypothetical protein HU200_042246 [Digitaria exilis]|uniref:Uncharacterized protein n=1 Tax=Digitaria exilis TaxID=1010633 RepID=A0A835EIK2_9POAL|nr:hypothetical protein HU200_042246 [Digitaria exilis]